MTKNHEQIPLLAKLEVSYICDKCRGRITLGTFYESMGNVVDAASVEDGKLICPTCQDKNSKMPMWPTNPRFPDLLPSGIGNKPLKGKG